MSEAPWQLQILEKSIKKKEKLKLITNDLNVRPNYICLDLGCAQGILSYFLRQKGGYWVSTDEDFLNLKSSQSLIGENLVQVKEGILPFKDEAFDLVVCLDYLEHLENDDLCLQEIQRVLKKGRELLLATPLTGRFFIIQKLRPALGMKLEYYGHKREGYSLKELGDKLRIARFEFLKHKTFSRFFSEFLELFLNFFYIKILRSKPESRLRDGHIRPATVGEFDSQKRAFQLYSFVYPVVWLFSRLDALLFFQRGYSLMVWARKSTGL